MVIRVIFSNYWIGYVLTYVGAVIVSLPATAISGFPMSTANTTCSRKITTKTSRLQKTPTTNSSRIQFLMKTQTASEDRFCPPMNDSGYFCYCYRYFEKTRDLPMSYFLPCFRKKNHEKWLDHCILTSLLIVDLLYGLVVLLSTKQDHLN